MNFQSKIKDKNNLLLLLIVFAAVLLRFYHFDQIPFTHDEFSALFRTQFDNFQNLCECDRKKNMATTFYDYILLFC